MKEQNDILHLDDEPKRMAVDLIVGKNRWLIKTRWLYSIFIFAFFLVYNSIAPTPLIGYHPLILILLLSLGSNVAFILTLKRHLKLSDNNPEYKEMAGMAQLQLDFDLVILSLLVFFSGGFESPMTIFFIFFIMLSTFLISHEKGLKNTLIAMLLVVVIFFTNESSIGTMNLTTMIGFNVILFFSYLLSAFMARNLKENEEKVRGLMNKFQEQSVSDGLTGLYNQAHFFLLLNLQLDKAKRYHTEFAVIMFDLDNFKNFNDHNGHILGSETLRKLAGIMKKIFRSSDMLCKYGGDEFVIILPNSDKIGAFLAAERLRETVEAEPFEGGQYQPMGKVTLSLGISSYPEHGATTTEILDKADRALYFSKETGRNKTVIFNDEVAQMDMTNKT